MDDADHAAGLTDFQVELRLADIRRQNAEAPAHDTAQVRVCTDCDDPIEPERLAVKPDARRCIHCQVAAERQAQAYGSGVRA